MTAVAFYVRNILREADSVSVVGLASTACSQYLHDDRLSFAAVTTASSIEVTIDQSTSPLNYNSLAILEHDVFDASANLTLSGAATSDFGSGVSVIEGQTITENTTSVFDLASTRNDNFVFVKIAGNPGTTLSVGELFVGEKFSPQQDRLGVGINTLNIPRTTIVNLPNGEVQTIKHAEVVRQKQLIFPGLTVTGSDTFIEALNRDSGTGLFVLEDERGAKYPGTISGPRLETDFAEILEVTVTFTEVKLKE